MKNVREIGPGREQDDITGNYSKFREMISYARMHEGSENRVYCFQSMAHGDVEKQKCIGLVPTKAWELYHSKLLPRQRNSTRHDERLLYIAMASTGSDACQKSMQNNWESLDKV